MQVSCPDPSPAGRHPAAGSASALWSTLAAALLCAPHSGAWAQMASGSPVAAVTTVASLSSPSSATAPSGSAASSGLLMQVGQWVAARQGVDIRHIQVQAPDPRLRVPECPGGFSLDAPFGPPQTVRARCTQPAWQMFLRVTWDGAAEPARPALADASREGTGRETASRDSRDSRELKDPAARTAEAVAAAPAPTRRVVVLSRALPRGALLSPASGELLNVPAREADALVVTDLQLLQQVETVRDLPAGVPLRSTDIRPAVLVKQGQMVLLTVGDGSGFRVSVRLEALQDGRMGDRISLRNTESGRTVSGVVTGPNQAQGA